MASYRLSGGDNSELQRLVNSRVEVMGTLQGDQRGGTGTSGTGAGTTSGTGATGTGTGSTGTGTGSTGSATGSASTGAGSSAGAAGGDRNMQTLRVSSVRQVSGSCSGGEGR
jgi:hypothetical protein